MQFEPAIDSDPRQIFQPIAHDFFFFLLSALAL